jgi:hypothetical protein
MVRELDDDLDGLATPTIRLLLPVKLDVKALVVQAMANRMMRLWSVMVWCEITYV